MHFLLLKVVSAVGMGLVLKRVDAGGMPRLPVIRMNYLAAAVLAFAACLVAGQDHISRPTALLGIVTGILFVAGLVFWAQTIRVAGLALSVVTMRLAIVIPVLASVVVWRERPSGLELAGSAAALVALGLVLSDIRRPAAAGPGQSPNPRSRFPAWMWLLGLFVVDGLVMVPAQVFSRQLPGNENLPFQTVIFASAFVVTTVIYYLRRSKVNPAALSWGAALGACNLGNYLFLVMALTVLPGIVVYPVMAAAEVGFMALAGVLVWRERVGTRSWLGIGLAILALALIRK